MDDVVKTLRDRVSPSDGAPFANRPSRAEAEAAVRLLIGYIGDDTAREGLLETPRRVVAALDEFYAGYTQDPAEGPDPRLRGRARLRRHGAGP